MDLRHLLLLTIFISSEAKSISVTEIIEGGSALRATFYRCLNPLEPTQDEQEEAFHIQQRCIEQNGGPSGVLARILEENSSTRSGNVEREPPSRLADVLTSARRSHVAQAIKDCLMPNGTFNAEAVKERALRKTNGSEIEDDLKLAIDQCKIDDKFQGTTEFLRCVAVRCAGYDELITSLETTESYEEAYIDLIDLEPSDIVVSTQPPRYESDIESCIEIGSHIAEQRGIFNKSEPAVGAVILSKVEGSKIENVTKIAIDLCHTDTNFDVMQFLRCVILHCSGNGHLVDASDEAVKNFFIEYMLSQDRRH